jgi:hypothetical protein
MRNTLLVTLFFCIAGTSMAQTSPCDAFIGSYAIEKGKPAVIWIEKDEQQFVASSYDWQKKEWIVYRRPLESLTDRIYELPVETDRNSCAIGGERIGGVLVHTFIGAKYTGRPLAPKNATTGFLVFDDTTGPAGYAFGGEEIYPVTDTKKPPPPEQKAP